ncbi:MAG: site-specific integrase [Candidatus Methanomethylicaceae archaeon]
MFLKGDLTKEVLKKILEHLELKGRTLVLFLASSGIRIGEALKLKLNDIDLDQDPPIVYVRGEYTKSGDSYYTFISKEAKESLIEWLKIREQFLNKQNLKEKE